MNFSRKVFSACDERVPIIRQGVSVLRRRLLAFPGGSREPKAPRCPFPAEAVTLAANQKGHPRVGRVWGTERGQIGTQREMKLIMFRLSNRVLFIGTCCLSYNSHILPKVTLFLSSQTYRTNRSFSNLETSKIRN